MSDIEQAMKDWYDKNYRATNMEPDAVIEHRIQREAERKRKQQEDFWNEIAKRTKFNVDIKCDNTIECSAAAIQVTKPEDVKIQFGG